MRSHKTRSTRDRSITRSLQKISFDEILDLTAGVSSFYNILSDYTRVRVVSYDIICYVRMYTNLFLFLFLFFFHPIYCLRPSILSLLVATQIRGHILFIAGSSSPLPTAVRAIHFYREKISSLSSLVDSRRIVLTHARRSQQLTLFYYCF